MSINTGLDDGAVPYSGVGVTPPCRDQGQYPGADGARQLRPRQRNLVKISHFWPAGPIFGPLGGSGFHNRLAFPGLPESPTEQPSRWIRYDLVRVPNGYGHYPPSIGSRQASGLFLISNDQSTPI